MEVLNVLEKKIAGLIELIKELRADKTALEKEKTSLLAKVEKLEAALLVREKGDNERNKEIALTKSVVTDLIKSIDLLVGQEQ